MSARAWDLKKKRWKSKPHCLESSEPVFSEDHRVGLWSVPGPYETWTMFGRNIRTPSLHFRLTLMLRPLTVHTSTLVVNTCAEACLCRAFLRDASPGTLKRPSHTQTHPLFLSRPSLVPSPSTHP